MSMWSDRVELFFVCDLLLWSYFYSLSFNYLLLQQMFKESEKKRKREKKKEEQRKSSFCWDSQFAQLFLHLSSHSHTSKWKKDRALLFTERTQNKRIRGRAEEEVIFYRDKDEICRYSRLYLTNGTNQCARTFCANIQLNGSINLPLYLLSVCHVYIKAIKESLRLHVELLLPLHCV